MTAQVPRLITLDVGRTLAERQSKREPLCIAEMLSLIEELADLGVERIRLLLHDVEAIDDLERLIQYARRRRCAVTAVCRTHVDAACIATIAEAGPDAIELPFLRQIVRPHSTLPVVPALSGADEAMHVSWSGDVSSGGIVLGNVRVQTFDTIQELSRVSTRTPGIASTRQAVVPVFAAVPERAASPQQ